jgi:pyruvate ferredoxin oxidoreductase delta subunit
MSAKILPIEKPEAGWKDITWGAVIPKGGTAREFLVGGWRSEKPVWNSDKCISCLMCWLYCPDMAIQVEDGKVAGIDYDHCKGCGICASVCPPKVQAIEIVPENA